MSVSSEEEWDFHSSCELWAVWRTETSRSRFHGDIIAVFQPAGEPENNSSPGTVGMGRKGVRYANCKRGDFN